MYGVRSRQPVNYVQVDSPAMIFVESRQNNRVEMKVGDCNLQLVMRQGLEDS